MTSALDMNISAFHFLLTFTFAISGLFLFNLAACDASV